MKCLCSQLYMGASDVQYLEYIILRTDDNLGAFVCEQSYFLLKTI